MIRERQQCNFDFRYYLYVHIHGDVTGLVIRSPIDGGEPGGITTPHPTPRTAFYRNNTECSKGIHAITQVVCHSPYRWHHGPRRATKDKSVRPHAISPAFPEPPRQRQTEHIDTRPPSTLPRRPQPRGPNAARTVKLVSDRDTERHREDQRWNVGHPGIYLPTRRAKSRGPRPEKPRG